MLKCFLIAGEASGDYLGAQLMRSLKPQAAFQGIGGPLMAQEGLTSCFPYQELSLIGLVEILPKAFRLLRRIAQTVETIKQAKPDVIITIDSPGFNFRVANQVRAFNIPLIHYVAPQVWAWRPKRALQVKQLFDHLLCLFPFELPYFEAIGVPTTFVGHPVIEQVFAADPNFLTRQQVTSRAIKLTLLPGSRASEVLRLLPVFIKAVTLLQQSHPDLCVFIPTLPHLKVLVTNILQECPVPWKILEPQDKWQGFYYSNIAFAAGGTVTLELACAGVPVVTTYRLSALTYFYAKHLVKLKYINMVNILLDQPLLPECIQDDCTPESLYQAALELLNNSVQQQSIKQGYQKVLALLTPPAHPTPSAAAAAVIKSHIMA